MSDELVSGEQQYDDASRVEAAEAGGHAETAEAAAGQTPGRHVTATDVAGLHPHHHPADANIGVVRMRLGAGAVIGGVLATLITVAALVALALAIGSH